MQFWVNKQTGQIQLASADPELEMIMALPKTWRYDREVRELLRRHGMPYTRR